MRVRLVDNAQMSFVKVIRYAVPAFLLLVVANDVAMAAEPLPRRAKPPEWTDAERQIFFEDAHQMLVGDRPDFGVGQEPAAVASSETSSSGAPKSAAAGQPWSKIVSAETIETEIKRQSRVLTGLVRSAAAFKAGGYREAGDALAMLAVLFRTTAEHDAAARWKDQADATAGVLARAAANCKVGTDGSYRDAQQRAQQIEDLVRGSRASAAEPVADPPPPSRVALMRRMEQAESEKLTAMTNSERALSRNAEDVLVEAELLAMLAVEIVRPGADDADDSDYAAYASQLQQAARDLADAAEQENYEAARQATGNISKSCIACHADYRG